MITAFILSLFGLLGFIASMCTVVYLFWRQPKKEIPLPDGTYHIHFIGQNPRTGAPIYDVDQVDEPAAKASITESK